MRKLLLALLLAASANAQQVVSTMAGDTDRIGAIVTANDVLVLPISGSRWATVRLSVSTAGTATATAQVSIDGGVNYIPSAYGKLVSAVSANPTVQAISATTLTTGNVWEFALPANATHFRVLCAGTGASTLIQLLPGQLYTPGAVTQAVLADVTEGSIGAGITSTVYDTSGWTTVLAIAVSPTTQVFTVRAIDDAGSIISGAAAVFTAASGGSALLTRTSGNTTSSTVGANAQAVYGWLERRISVTLPAGGTLTTGRYRLAASR